MIVATCEVCGCNRHVQPGARFETVRSVARPGPGPVEMCADCEAWLNDDPLIPKVMGEG